MYISKVMLLRAPRMIASFSGKISSPFTSARVRLPGTSAGPSITFMVRANCGSATPLLVPASHTV